MKQTIKKTQAKFNKTTDKKSPKKTIASLKMSETQPPNETKLTSPMEIEKPPIENKHRKERNNIDGHNTQENKNIDGHNTPPVNNKSLSPSNFQKQLEQALQKISPTEKIARIKKQVQLNAKKTTRPQQNISNIGTKNTISNN